jgi:hypothetical protein
MNPKDILKNQPSPKDDKWQDLEMALSIPLRKGYKTAK